MESYDWAICSSLTPLFTLFFTFLFAYSYDLRETRWNNQIMCQIFLYIYRDWNYFCYECISFIIFHARLNERTFNWSLANFILRHCNRMQQKSGCVERVNFNVLCIIDFVAYLYKLKLNTTLGF